MLASQIPTKIPLPFANSGTKNAIPTASQIGVVAGAASLTDGFPPLTFTPLASGGVPPAGADFNGIFNLITAVQQWQSAGGIFKYDSAFSTSIGGYPKGAILLSTSNDTQWLNLLDSNTTDPDSAAATNWASLAAYGVATIAGLSSGTVTATPAQYGKSVITLTGALTGNVTINFPVSQQLTTIANNTTGAFTVTVKTAAGAGAVVTQGGQETIYGDGVNLNPRLGSTPPQFDASSRLATTNFVKQASLQAANVVVITASRALTVADLGKLLVVNAAIVITMPLAGSLPAGAAFNLINATGASAFTVSRAGSDGFNTGGPAGTVNSISINAGDQITLISDGLFAYFNGGGTSFLQFSNSFTSSKATNGYQKLPSGVIIQWGAATTGTGAPGSVVVSFPIAFPSAVVAIHSTRYDSASSSANTVTNVSSPALSTFTLWSSTAPALAYWSAIGY